MTVLRCKVPAAWAAVVAVLCLANLASANAAQLLVVGSRHCPYCVAWEREIGRTYSDSEVGRQAPVRHLDIDAKRPADLSRIRGLEVTPTFVLVEEGQEVGRITGYDGKQAFWPQLRKLLSRLHPQG
jgi:thioredoxin-related protein